jgi:hypothetical protein
MQRLSDLSDLLTVRKALQIHQHRK